MKRLAKKMSKLVKKAESESENTTWGAESTAEFARFEAERVELATDSGEGQMWMPSWEEQD